MIHHGRRVECFGEVDEESVIAYGTEWIDAVVEHFALSVHKHLVGQHCSHEPASTSSHQEWTDTFQMFI